MRLAAFLAACFALSSLAQENPPAGMLPLGDDGKPLNLDFETGTLKDWTAQGDAFASQPIKGDTVSKRRSDMKSNHQGEFWIGSFEISQDKPTGTLTSATFKVTHPWASFLVAGGAHEMTRVELVQAETQKVIFTVRGDDRENLRRAVVDLQKLQNKPIFIRIIDQHAGGWGHINFDDFRFHAAEPKFPPAQVIKAPPPLDVVKHQGLSADQAVAEMKLPEGFKATVFAAEPDIVQPVAMAIDDRGRVWVAEAMNYPKKAPEGEGKDRILIFEDTNGDGRHDKRTVFIEGLNLVSGIEVGFGGVWVGAAPQFLFIPDKDGDDKPDGPAQVLLDGWGHQDTHETLNAFIWGPDGWMYGCHGVFTHSKVGKPGTPEDQRIKINAGVWRYHPIKHKFEVFAEGTSNPWGVDFNDVGQSFITACVIPHLYHIIQGARYQRQSGQHFNPYTFADLKTIADHVHWAGAGGPHAGNNRSDAAGGGHAHCGAMIYLGDSWPAPYRNALFMSNIHGNRLNVDHLDPRGSGYVGKHGKDFLFTNDKWSRLINFRYGPDGDVYAIDWYDKQACHLNQPEKWDRGNGRIYKISYSNPQRPTPAPGRNLASLSEQELVALQFHANDFVVRHARRNLQERQARSAIPALQKMLADAPDTARRLRVIWALHVIGGLDEATLSSLMDHADPYIRAWAIQLACEDNAPSAALIRNMERLSEKDSSQVVRLYLASAVQRLEPAARWTILRNLVAHEEDASDHNLPCMYWYALEPLVGVDKIKALKLATEGKIPVLREYVTRRMAATVKSSG